MFSVKGIGGIKFTKPYRYMGIVGPHTVLELQPFNEEGLREYLLSVSPDAVIFTVTLDQEEVDLIHELYKHGLLDMAFEEIKKKRPFVIKQRFLHRFLGTVRRLFNLFLIKVI
jgi:hypothetical protein